MLTFHDSDYVPRIGLRNVDAGGGVIRVELISLDASGVPVTVLESWNTAGLHAITPYDLAPVADAVPNLIAGVNRVVLTSTTGTKVITTQTSGATAVTEGQRIAFVAPTVSGGSYTLAVTGGTLTFNAAGEGAIVERRGSAWIVVGLGTATVV